MLVILGGAMLIAGAIIGWYVAGRLSASSQKVPDQILDDLKSEKTQLNEEKSAMQGEISRLSTDLAVREKELSHAREELKNKASEIEKLQETMRKEFQLIANELMDKNAQKLQTTHVEKLKDLLEPFRTKIREFEQKVETTHKESIEKNAALTEQIRGLQSLSEEMNKEARNLAAALKGEKKLQGDWGERQLETLLQYSGLERNTHYQAQSSLKNEDGKNLRPDFIINLPDNKHLVIDSKVSIVAYESYFNEENPEKKERFLQVHIKNISDHIADLSSKDYASLLGINSPDYVMMYVPIEAALTTALSGDPKLFEKALKKNIVLVSNTTLLAVLKTISYIWQQENQNRNAQEIAKAGGLLYDKFRGFIETLQSVGKRIDGAKEDYDKAMKQLVDGKGNLVSRVEKLREMGASISKPLPGELLNEAKDE